MAEGRDVESTLVVRDPELAATQLRLGKRAEAVLAEIREQSPRIAASA